MTCPKCQVQNSEGAKFCVNCGTNLEGLASVAPSQTPSPIQPVKKSKGKKLLIGIAVFLILAFLIYTGARALYVQIKDRFLQNVPTPTTTTQFPSFPTAAPTPTPRPPATPIQTVGTEFQGVNAVLTEVTRKGGVVTVKLDLGASNDSSDLDHTGAGTKICTVCHPLITSMVVSDKDTPYSLATGFLVDENNQMKYEVLKDSSGSYLASTNVLQMLRARESISLYAQFTAPPTTSKSVTINFPKIQPFTGISLE